MLRTAQAGQALFQWGAHTQRLVDSAATLLPSAAATQANVDSIQATGRALCAGLVRQFQAAGHAPADLRITLLLVSDHAAAHAALAPTLAGHASTTGNAMVAGALGEAEAAGALVMLAHGEILPPAPTPPVQVQAAVSQRSHAHAKDSAWVRERAELEAQCLPESNEMLLVTPDGQLLEGTQTNAFALSSAGQLRTADAGVLKGSVRSVVLEAAAAVGTPVDVTPANVLDAPEWQGLSISSTSRLHLPVQHLKLDASALAGMLERSSAARAGPAIICHAPAARAFVAAPGPAVPAQALDSVAHVAYVPARINGKLGVHFRRTFVPPSARGGGVAGKLVAAATTWAAAWGLPIASSCSYVLSGKWRRDTEFPDVATYDAAVHELQPQAMLWHPEATKRWGAMPRQRWHDAWHAAATGGSVYPVGDSLVAVTVPQGASVDVTWLHSPTMDQLTTLVSQHVQDHSTPLHSGAALPGDAGQAGMKRVRE